MSTKSIVLSSILGTVAQTSYGAGVLCGAARSRAPYVHLTQSGQTASLTLSGSQASELAGEIGLPGGPAIQTLTVDLPDVNCHFSSTGLPVGSCRYSALHHPGTTLKAWDRSGGTLLGELALVALQVRLVNVVRTEARSSGDRAQQSTEFKVEITYPRDSNAHTEVFAFEFTGAGTCVGQ